MNKEPFKQPYTHMDTEECLRFAALMNTIPPNVGWMMSCGFQPAHTPPVFDRIHAVVVLPGPGVEQGDGFGNTMAEAMLRALLDAHTKSASNLKLRLEVVKPT